MGNMRLVLIHFHIKYDGDWNKIYKALEYHEPVSQEDFKKLGNINKNYITIIDKEFPVKLKSSVKPPFVIKRETKTWN